MDLGGGLGRYDMGGERTYHKVMMIIEMCCMIISQVMPYDLVMIRIIMCCMIISQGFAI